MNANENASSDSTLRFLKAEWIEFHRPWKLTTLMIGLALLIAGVFLFPAPDWDIPICFIMAIPTYLTAPLGIRVFLERRWKLMPLAIVFAWLSVDGLYGLYWNVKNPHTLSAMRWANFPASLSLYGMCGMIWLYRGNLRELFNEASSKFHLR